MLRKHPPILLEPDATDKSGGAVIDNDAAFDNANGSDNTLPSELPAGALQEKTPTTLQVKLESKSGANKSKAEDNKAKEAAALVDEELIGDLGELEDKGIVTKTIAQQKEIDLAKEREEKATKEVKDEVKVDAEGKPIVEKAASIDKKTGRDYSIFNEEDAKVLRNNAPNPIFNYFKDRLPKLYKAEQDVAKLTKELADAQKGIVKMPENIHEHPMAFVLNPDYPKLQKAIGQVSAEEAHWLAQLEAFENKQPWYDIAGFDKATGRLVSDDNANEDFGIRARDLIQQNLAKARQYKEQFTGKIVALKDGHLNDYKKQVDEITEGCKKYFPWVTNDKLLAQEIEYVDPKDGKVGKATIKDTLAYAINLLPPIVRNSPAAQVIANDFVALAIANQKIRAYEAKLGVHKQNNADAVAAEPVGRTRATNSAAAKIEEDGKVPDTSDM